MIELFWPAPALSPNFRSRSHWPKTRALKKARDEAFYATKAAKVGIAAGDVPILLNVCFCPPDKRSRDIDNMIASLKPSFDGIADALGVNDSWFRPHFAVGEPMKKGRVFIEVVE